MLIPIGEFSNFNECMRAQQSKGHDRTSAEKICGEMESRAKGKNKKEQTEFLVKEVKVQLGEGKKKRLFGILSSDNLDRGNQRISKGLIAKWAGETVKIPLLSQHKNNWMEQVGVITGRKALGDNNALLIEATLLESTPIAKQFQEYVKELNDHGMGIALSIGASIPDTAFVEMMDENTKHKYTSIEDGELLEGSVVPIGMNRDAYGYLAKKYNLKDEEEEDQMTEDIVKQISDVTSTPTAPDYSTELKKAFEEIEALKKDLSESKKTNEKAITDVVVKAIETMRAEKKSDAINTAKDSETSRMSDKRVIKEVKA